MEGVEIRFLRADEAEVLTELVTQTYGMTYDAAWVYNPNEIAARIKNGTLVSTIGLMGDGTVVGHVALMREEPDANVLHAGVAIVSEAARGQHLFTRLKEYAADWARGKGVWGIFSEATAAHPYSQKANIDLGAHETGFLLGWIPSSVCNNAALEHNSRRQSVALFYLKENDGPARMIHAPQRYLKILSNIITTSGLHGTIIPSPPLAESNLPEKSEITLTHRDDHNLTIITVHRAGKDFDKVVIDARDTQVQQIGRDVVYLDLALEDPNTAVVLDAHLDRLGFAFAGVFANQHPNGDALRLQSLHRVEVNSADISTASAHGNELLTFILADVKATHANRR